MKGKLFSLLATALLCLVGACSSDDEPEVVEATPLNLTLAVENITENSADVNVTADDQDRTYYAGVLRSEDVAEGISDAELAASLMKDPNFSTGLRKGDATFTADGLVDNTQYLVVAFGINADGTADKVSKLNFMTAQKPVTGDKFTVSQVTPGYTSVKFHVQPRELSLQWYYYIMERANYDGYLSSEGEGGPITHTYYAWNNYGRDLSMNIGEFLRLVAYSGERDVEVPDLQPNKDYVIIVAYVDPVNQVDPTEIFDYEYSATPFTTLEATSEAPVVKFLDYGVNHLDDGYVQLYATVQASAAANGKYSFSSLAGWLAQGDIFSTYETNEEIAYTMANLFGRAFNDDMYAGITTQAGYTFTQSISEEDYDEIKPVVFSIWVSDEQGKRTAKAVRID